MWINVGDSGRLIISGDNARGFSIELVNGDGVTFASKRLSTSERLEMVKLLSDSKDGFKEA